MRSLHTLLRGVIDYAGLFPPAELELEPAAAEYAAHRAGPHRWALGRFVAPAGRLEELGKAAAPCLPAGDDPWRLSALIGADLRADLAAIAGFNAAWRGRAVVDAVELKAATPADVTIAVDAVGPGIEAYVELPMAGELPALLRAAKQHGARAKVRTGGVTSDAFPNPSDLLRFIRHAIEAGVPFKATAGLHHPLGGSYALTYQPESPRALMYGFLNLFLSAAFVGHGMGAADAMEVLTDASPDAFRFSDAAVEWRGRSLAETELARARRDVVASFGSCSFREPIADLRALKLL